MSAPYNDQLDIDGAAQLGFVDRRMRRLAKAHDVTRWNGRDGYEPSAQDHAYAPNHVAFDAKGQGAEIETRRWVNEPTVADQRQWISEMPDHCALVGRPTIDSAH